MHRAEVITVERRRRWSWTDKQQIVDETLMPGASISAVARRYGLHPSQVFAWRKAARDGDIAAVANTGAFDRAFAPIVVSGSPPFRSPPFSATDGSPMEIVLRNGRRIVVDASVDAAALDRVIDVLERR